MEFLQAYGKEIIAAILTLAAPFISRWLTPSTKLQYYTMHEYTYLIPQPLLDEHGEVVQQTQMAHAKTIVVKNIGSQAAKNLEVVFNWKPMFLNTWPSRKYSIHDSPDGRHSIIYESLAPKDLVGFELLAVNVPLPGVLSIRCEQVAAKEILIQHIQRYGQWTNWAILALMTFGGFTIVYLILWALQKLFL
ncbi:hypothetical protein [Pseudomonas sp. PSE14]|uniref:hypothetical protein n=1 Tax=Pseudomonas sp. PSE14 TaxID=3016341 RepID=UPI0023D87EA5|nr:hypothetical protein [Pseudomonas sp. PSE14]WEJ70444.1 hypothetical protein O6P39_17405 [Pseudomonas sp. PSE14]